MSEKTFTFATDVLPNTNSTLSLGNSTNKWKINGVVPGAAMEKAVDSSVSDSSTNLPTSQAVATYVTNAKDVLMYADYSDFPLQGADGIMYIDKTTGTMYRWNGTAYTSVGGGTPTAITNSEIDALFASST